MIDIIGLAGKAGAGKSSVAKEICSKYFGVQVSMADPIRAMLKVPLALLGEKQSALHDKKQDHIEKLGTSPRVMMQSIGAMMREANEDVFVHIAQARIDQLKETTEQLRTLFKYTDNIRFCYVIDDIRYDNEARWIKEAGGRLFLIDRPAKLLTKVPKHHSETGVSPEYIYETYQNDDDVSRIKEIANQIATGCKLIRDPEQDDEVIYFNPRSHNVH